MPSGSIPRSRPGFGAAVAVRPLGSPAWLRPKLIVVLLLAVLLASASGVAVYNRAEIGNLASLASKMLGLSAGVARNSPVLKNLSALLDQRSPGQRTQAELAKAKRRLAAKPHQRALGKVRPALPAPFVQALTVPPPVLVPDAVPVASQAAIVPALAPTAIISPPSVFIPGGGGVVPPGGGGGTPPGGGGPPVGPPTVEVPPVVTPVPEPTTWLTMLLGFFMLARTLRGRRPVTSGGAALAV